jgi:hypothetical protein
MTRRRPLRPLTACALALAASTLFGCSPEPAPTPSPSPAFASEEEAFAAAEETYRAYNDAGNRDRSVAQYLAGEALQSDIDAKRYLSERGLRLVGPSVIEWFTGIRATDKSGVARVETEICIDISASRVLDEAGNDVTPSDRPAKWRLTVTFVGSPEELIITDSAPNSDQSC